MSVIPGKGWRHLTMRRLVKLLELERRELQLRIPTYSTVLKKNCDWNHLCTDVLIDGFAEEAIDEGVVAAVSISKVVRL